MLSTQSATVARAAVGAAPIVGTVVARTMSTQLLADKYKAVKDEEPNFLECFKVCAAEWHVSGHQCGVRWIASPTVLCLTGYYKLPPPMLIFTTLPLTIIIEKTFTKENHRVTSGLW